MCAFGALAAGRFGHFSIASFDWACNLVRRPLLVGDFVEHGLQRARWGLAPFVGVIAWHEFALGTVVATTSAIVAAASAAIIASIETATVASVAVRTVAVGTTIAPITTFAPTTIVSVVALRTGGLHAIVAT